MTTAPFDYPSGPLVRRHGPRGYERAESFRAWLRDEFSFRCVFCLTRETWRADNLDVEHFDPVVRNPDRATVYGNLLYACRTCNGKKGSRAVPDPTVSLVRGDIVVESDGRLTPRTPDARELILTLGLNTRRQRELRYLMLRVVALAKTHDPSLYRRLMGYPAELPNLALLRPPGGNAKPVGVSVSHYARRERGELPETY